MSVLIAAENLSRYYDRHCAVDNISFNLSTGEVLGFLGPNGAGKTTTMQMLSGNLAPSTGTIAINGFDLLHQPLAAKHNLGYLPDTPPLYKELTVNEFLGYCAKIHRIPPKQIDAALKSAKHRCGLEAVAERLIQNLSQGYQQRVGIAQAILHNPPVIILDEPTIGLDPLQIREIRHLIRELGQDHGIILSTHILSEVQESCSHVQIIRQGKLILRKSIEELNLLMHSSILQITTRSPIELDRLNLIPGIASFESISPTKVLVHCVSDANITQISDLSVVTEQIVATIVNAGWGLLEIVPIRHSLEDIFIDLIQEPDPSLATV